MILIHSSSRLKSFRSIFLLLLLGPFACGVEVGNPTKPGPAPSADDQNQLALVVTDQLEETVAVAADGHGSDDASLRLLASRSCEVAADGSVIYKNDRDETGSRDTPLLNPRTRVAISTTKSSTATLRATGSGLGCRIGGRIPSVDWQSLSIVQSEISSKRATEKTLSSLPDGGLKETIQVSAEGSRQVTWRRESIDGSDVSLSRNINFHTALTRSSSLQTSSYNTTVETMDPLLVKQDNQGLTVKKLIFESGSILSDYKDGQKLLLSYNNLEFNKGSSCYPESGSIAAAVYSASDLKVPLISFSLVFQSGELSMVFTDGSSRAIELADCSLGSN